MVRAIRSRHDLTERNSIDIILFTRCVAQSGMKNKITKSELIAMSQKKACVYCKKEFTLGNIKKHEKSCFLNPNNIVRCAICNSPIKNYKESKGTCGYGCSNKYFRKGKDNGNWKGQNYQSICFSFHKKKCVVCGEDKIVAVHHYDCNHENNDPNNLVPLCPTHHSYMHSRYAYEIQSKIDEYVVKFLSIV